MKKIKIEDIQAFFINSSFILFWAPIITSLFGWYTLSTVLFGIFWVSAGLALILSVIPFMKERKNDSKTARFFQWFFLAFGVFMILIAAGLAEFDPILVVLFSLPLMRLVSSRSIVDILKDQPGAKHPWLDRVSDGLFIVSALLFILLFFGFHSSTHTGFMLVLLGLSLVSDQIHFGFNSRNWDRASGMITLATLMFLIPGALVLING